MKDRKWDFIPFSFYDRTGMAAHLENRAAQGWMLERISPFGWFYRRISPAQLHFTVTYNHRMSEFAPGPTEEEQTYQDFCTHGGWQFVTQSGKMSFFSSAEPDPVPIETDPILELKHIGRAMRPIVILLFFWLLIGFWMGGSWCYSLINHPIDLLANSLNFATGLWWLGLFLYSAADLWSYFHWRHKTKQAAQLGEFVPTRGHHRLLLGVVALVAASLLYWLLTDQTSGMRMMTLAWLAIYLVLLLAVQGTKQFLKRRGAPTGVNRAVTLSVDVILAFVLCGVVFFFLLHTVRTGISSPELDAQPPLSIEALAGGNQEDYIHSVRREESVFLARLTVQQFTNWRQSTKASSLDYTLLDVKVPFLYSLCLNDMLQARNTGPSDYTYVTTAPTPWGAEAAYQLTLDGEALDRYLLCWPERMVSLDFNWIPTAEQMAQVGAAFNPAHAPDTAE